MANIFKSYDVRGIYPSDINEDIVYRIGRTLPKYLNTNEIAVATDNRTSSPGLFSALTKGITESGASVIDLGMLSTPMLYFASAKLGVGGAVMITASHNPAEYNGLKICRANAVPVGLSSGLAEIRDIALAGNFPSPGVIGHKTAHDVRNDYAAFMKSFADFRGKKFRLATDTAHAMGVLELPILSGLDGATIDTMLYETLEKPGTCPHEANPLNTSTLSELEVAVQASHADMGIAFDGDADRVGFVDETGTLVPMHLVTALLALALLPKYPGATVLYDLRSSRSVKEVIEAAGGVAHECMVGHANIKKQMIREGALLAGEASGHYYFSVSGYSAEMGTLPAILLMNLMAQTGKTLSQLTAEVTKYAHSGELNLEVADAPKLLRLVRARYSDGKISELDGIKIEYADWWFSLRSSNTEPLLRLNIEANSEALLSKHKEELLALLENK